MFTFLIKKVKTTPISLRFGILSIFVTFIVLTTLAVMLIRSFTFNDQLTATSRTLMQYVAKTKLEEERNKSLIFVMTNFLKCILPSIQVKYFPQSS